MNSVNDPALNYHEAMGRFQQEVVRWNRQINLVSRQDTLRRVAGLISQCRGAWLELEKAELQGWDRDGRVWYFDLGSGGGVPGYVWHHLLAARFPQLNTWLVEPREKRAWFLERLNRIAPERPLQVWRARWGEAPPGEAPPGETPSPMNIVISLKALRLTEPAVLTGLARAAAGLADFTGGRLAIARFYPPQQAWTSALRAELAFPDDPVRVAGGIFTPDQQRILAPHATEAKAASLVLSTYRISS